MVNSVEMYIMIFFTYSFLGWFMESVGGILKEKRFINRGFLIGPYCPVYGTGVVLITLLLNKYTNDIPVLFFLAILICGVLEYLTSYLMEKFFNARWWDYSKSKFNINGRICLDTLIPFGIAGSVILCKINPFFVNIYSIFPNVILKIIAYTLALIFTIDVIVSLKIILSFKKETYKKEDNTEEISDMVKDKAEDLFMKTESDIIVFSRRLKAKELKLQRKLRIKGKKFYSDYKIKEKIDRSKEYIDNKLKENKERLLERLQDAKENFDVKHKENIEKKIEDIKISSEEFTKQIKERFKSASVLKARLMDAFPDLKIDEKYIEKIKEKSKKK